MCYYPFKSNLDRFNGSCNTLDDLSKERYVSNKTEDVNISFWYQNNNNWIKTSTKYISCKCKCKFDGRKWQCEWKNSRKNHLCVRRTYLKTIYLWKW